MSQKRRKRRDEKRRRHKDLQATTWYADDCPPLTGWSGFVYRFKLIFRLGLGGASSW